MTSDAPSEPWRSFLSAIDERLREPVDLHCLGGFVISQCYGLHRATADLDFLAAIPTQAASELVHWAGQGSPLHRLHRVYLDAVTVVSAPDSYESRLTRVFPFWHNLRLWALEPHDLALTKLERSIERDLQDVLAMAAAGLLSRQTLLSRYETELAPYLIGRTPNWNKDTLRMWIEACWPTRPGPGNL